MPSLYIISGCNGAGKTTASYTLLPDLLNCDEYVNSDEIAKGLSPFNPALAAIKASKLMTERIHELLEKRATFGVETTLATRSLARVVTGAQAIGYRVTLVYFWLQVPELAIQRVRLRVASGGHSVPEDTIIRRYGAGIDNLFHIYMPIVDYWMIIDNSNTPSKLVAEGGLSVVTKLHDKTAYNQILNYERAREQGS